MVRLQKTINRLKSRLVKKFRRSALSNEWRKEHVGLSDKQYLLNMVSEAEDDAGLWLMESSSAPVPTAKSTQPHFTHENTWEHDDHTDCETDELKQKLFLHLQPQVV